MNLKKMSFISAFRRKSVFWKTFGMLSALTMVSLIVFAIFVNLLLVENQRSKIHELNQVQLRRIGEDVDLRFEILADNMSQELWSTDFVSGMVSPNGVTSEERQRIVSALAGYVSSNALVKKTLLYVSASDDVYSSVGNYLSLEYSTEKKLIEYYLANHDQERTSQEETDRKLFTYNQRLFQAMDFCVPNFIGVLFFEIDLDQLYQLIQDGDASKSSEVIQIYEKSDNSLYLQRDVYEKPDFSDSSLFMTDASLDNAEWYRYTSEITGWTFIREANTTGIVDSWTPVLSLMLPFLIAYAVLSQMFSLYITRSIYRPINRLMQITTQNGRQKREVSHPEAIQNEADYLELVYTDTLGQNTQHRQLMEAISNDIMEQLFRGVLSGKSMSQNYIQGALEGTGRKELFTGRYMALAGMLLLAEDRELTMVEAGLYQRSIVGIINNLMDEHCQIFSFYPDKEVMAVILCFPEDTSVIRAKQWINGFLQEIKNRTEDLPYQVLWGKGKFYNEITSLRYSYQEALAEVRYQRYMASDPEAVETGNAFDRKYYEERSHQVAEMAEKGSREEAESMADILISEIAECDPEKARDYAELVMDVMIEKMISCHVSKVELKELGLFHNPEEIIRIMQENGLNAYMKEFYQKAIKAVQSGSKKNRYKYVEEAQDYIEAHYSNGNLTLNEVSEAIGISAPYLSGVFNEVKRETFSSYLNSFRVKRAKQFLEETNQSIAEIGYKCGFNSAQSFSRVFKKHTTFTPGQYRERKKGVGSSE